MSLVDVSGIEILGAVSVDQAKILTHEALAFVADLHRRFNPTRKQLLQRRSAIQERLNSGDRPDFLSETRDIREADWCIGAVPPDLRDRRVEITGPVDRKMIINALNSHANVFMADFEDSHSPTWHQTLDGQTNLRDAVRRTISYVSPQGKTYLLRDRPAVLVVRPRGWHLYEEHVAIDGEMISASLFDFGLYFFHNAFELLRRGSGPYFYLPKMENSLEARLWNEVFIHAQKSLGLAVGTIKATVLIETILAAFEMDEILYELREHVVGLNCGRWDYIFSFIKKFQLRDFALLPDRALVTMNSPFLRSYSKLLIHTAHRRGAHAMGGMAAQIPIRSRIDDDPNADDAKAHQAAMRQVWNDKEREVNLGHDGTWVAHPGLVQLAKSVFDETMKQPNQLHVARDKFQLNVDELLQAPSGAITELGVRKNIRVSLIYLESWLRGVGCVPIDHLMEDAATAEISRAQIWQWLRHPRATLSDGRKLTEHDVRYWTNQELDRILKDSSFGLPGTGGGAERFDRARLVFETLIYQDRFAEFLTLAAYPQLSEAA